MSKQNILCSTLIIMILLILLSGCVLPAQGVADLPPLATRRAYWQQTLTPSLEILEPLPNEQDPDPDPGPDEPTVDETAWVFLHPGLPQNLVDTLNLPDHSLTDDQQEADLRILLGHKGSVEPGLASSIWIYALAAPFYTISDGHSLEELTALWAGRPSADLTITQIQVTPEAYAAMQELFGDPDDAFVKVVTREALTELALTDQAFLTLLPFEELTPHWKVLRVDGQSPIDDTFAPENYPLTVHIWLEGDPDQILLQPAANYDADRRTVLMMTGVTALTRATAHRMETQGNHYPGRDIQPWLASADLVHISNEVPFARNCPYPDPFQSDLIFCSSPDRIELLEYISTDIIELSGNHTLDYGVQAMNLTLEMYAERGWVTYAGGWDLQDARSPALVTHHGNQLAFIGCNPVGPPVAWATNTSPGAAPCGDYQWLVEEIQALRAGGYLPIVTLQYTEDYTAYPSTQMVADFQRLADAGALIVNGSQAHTPKSMVFYGDSFLHYGLGNLFFDQMEVYYNDFLMPGTREAFIDRLVFYEGDLISVELLTTMLEDYARPRPMSPGEREALLSRIFQIALQAYE